MHMKYQDPVFWNIRKPFDLSISLVSDKGLDLYVSKAAI